MAWGHQWDRLFLPDTPEVFPTLSLAQNPIPALLIHIPLWPEPCAQGGAWCPGLAVPLAAPLVPVEAKGWGAAGKTLPQHSPEALTPFVFKKLLGWLPRLHHFISLTQEHNASLDHDELCHLISWRWALDKINTGFSPRMEKVINYYQWQWSYMYTLLSRWIPKHFANVSTCVNIKEGLAKLQRKMKSSNCDSGQWYSIVQDKRNVKWPSQACGNVTKGGRRLEKPSGI